MNLPPLDLTHPQVTPDPYRIYKQYRELSPVHHLPPRVEGDADRYILTRYTDVVSGLKHRDLGRSFRRGHWDESTQNIPPEHLEYARTLRDWALFRDPPEHSKLRHPINRICAELAADNFREWVATEAARLAETLEGQSEVDLVNDFSTRLTTGLVSKLIGFNNQVSFEDLDSALACIPLVISNYFDPKVMGEASDHMARLRNELQTLLNKPADHPAEARLLASIVKDAQVSKVSEHEQRSMAILLLIATRDNVRNLMGNAVLNFLRHPPVWNQLGECPDKMEQAVDEVLRFEPPVQFVSRNALKDLTLAEVFMPANSAVIFALASANRDPEYFTNPDHFDIERENVKIASFGFGIHRCPGDLLARIIAEEALKVLVHMWKNPQLAAQESQLVWLKSRVFRGLTSLPLRI